MKDALIAIAVPIAVLGLMAGTPIGIMWLTEISDCADNNGHVFGCIAASFTLQAHDEKGVPNAE